jgi:CheY-like chemotaxis protein
MQGRGHRTVLFADDNHLVREYVRAVLEPEGVTLLTTKDGEEAVRLAREKRPDAIVLDVLMPRLDGLSALMRLKGDEATRDIPVMMVSGIARNDVEPLAAAYGADAFLEKPLRVSALVEGLRRLLERERSATGT